MHNIKLVNGFTHYGSSYPEGFNKYRNYINNQLKSTGKNLSLSDVSMYSIFNICANIKYKIMSSFPMEQENYSVLLNRIICDLWNILCANTFSVEDFRNLQVQAIATFNFNQHEILIPGLLQFIGLLFLKDPASAKGPHSSLKELIGIEIYFTYKAYNYEEITPQIAEVMSILNELMPVENDTYEFTRLKIILEGYRSISLNEENNSNTETKFNTSSKQKSSSVEPFICNVHYLKGIDIWSY